MSKANAEAATGTSGKKKGNYNPGPQPLTLVPSTMKGLVSLQAGDMDLSRFEQKSQVELLKPVQIPVGGMVSGILKEVKEIKSKKVAKPMKIAVLQDTTDPKKLIGICLVSAISSSLGITDKVGELGCEYIGHEIAVINKGKEKTGGQGGKGYWKFDVFVAPEKYVASVPKKK